MEQHKIQDGIQTQIQFLEMIYMVQYIKMEKQVLVHLNIHGGGLLRLLLLIAGICAMLTASFLVCTMEALMAMTICSRCLPVLPCSVLGVA